MIQNNKNKINLSKINFVLSKEFPKTKLILANTDFSKLEIYYNSNNNLINNNSNNNFNKLDGGTKDRIIRKTKILLLKEGIVGKNNKNIIIIKN